MKFLFQEIDDDDLDDYMAALSKTGKGASESKENISKVKLKLGTLRQDLAKVERLIEVARPAKLPELKPGSTAAPAASKLGKFSGIMVGKRKGGGISSTLRVLAPPAPQKPASPSPVIEEQPSGKKPELDVKEEVHVTAADPIPDDIPGNVVDPPVAVPEVKEKKVFGMKLQPVRKPEPPKKVPKPVKPVSVRSSDVEEESVWVPPAGQTGDGRTALNEKFGY